MTSLDGLISVLLAVADDVIGARDELNRLDGNAGDGDMGITMATAARSIKELRPELESLDLAAALRRCGTEIARKAPSTSGTLLATALLRAGRAATEASGTPARQLAALVEAAQTGIQERGKAVPGDKTLLDALAPATEALRQAAAEDVSLARCLEAAASAAADGAAATRTMRPRIGRASWMPDRSEGNEDPGAHLVALVFSSAARHTAR